jgi:invasion protein IalB
MAGEGRRASTGTTKGTTTGMTGKPTLPAFAALGAAVALALALGLANTTTAAAQSAKLLKSFTDWTLYASPPGPQKTCFASSQPKETAPGSVKRNAAYFYISAWPKEGVKSEISVKLGFDVKPGSEVTVSIGNDTFKLFTESERAFVADPMQELKLIDAMKKGSQMTVRAISERGTATTDTYSLMGITQALNTLASSC